jgi:hypothetical protein
MKYRKKPVVIEAVQWTGENTAEVDEFTNSKFGYQLGTDNVLRVCIDTLEGTMLANPGDYIIKGVNGEFYPCKPDVFAKTYEPVEE